MHILVITPGFPKNESDNDCIPAMQDYFKALKTKYPNILISIVAIHYPFEKGIFSWNGIKVFAIAAKRSRQPLRFFYWIKAAVKAININRKNKVNIIHSFWLNENALLGVFLSKLLKLKHINTMMGQDAKSNNKYLKLLPLNKITIIAVSEFQASVFLSSTGKMVDEVVNWGIEIKFHKNEKRTIDILGVGALIPIKNFMKFVEVISELKKEFPEINCVIAGDGSEREKIERLICNLGLLNNIKLTGHIIRENVLKLMAESKLLLHTSKYESFGYVLIEALASGCNVLSSQTGCAIDGKYIITACKKAEFIFAATKILKSNNDFSSVVPYPITDTVKNYYRLYENLSN